MRPPLGVTPHLIWADRFRDRPPTLADWLVRYIDVNAAAERYHAAGRPRPLEWLMELGVEPAAGTGRKSRTGTASQ